MTEPLGGEPTLDWERRHWQRIEVLFEAAEALSEAERAAYLDQHCHDPRLRRRLDALLAAEVATADAVGGLAAEVSPFAAARAGGSSTSLGGVEEPVPERIGAYDVLHEVGRGGSSSVFLAERADGAFRKRVAVKLVRRGLDTQDILRRLHQERQILAGLDHPNIARLLDGGSLPDGRPYLVMDYAEGLPIDEACREQAMDLRARIELFIEVCRAVQFAHQNLTIHRDIKPSNILVRDDGTAKLLDFGIAKLVEPPDGLSWQVTRPGVRFMTPAYASPEQLRGEALSTATDVYSLGVLLHRLVTGVLPYAVDQPSLERLEAEIEKPRPKPSQRVDADAMRAMGLEPSQDRRHRALLAGDLDTIVAMALRVEPDRRYGSAEQLADDLQRHLDGLPVRAQADSWRYRAKKFAVRHARALVAVAAGALLLAAVVGFFSVRLIHERDRAFQASNRAQLESSTSAQVTDFLQQIFAVSNPSRSLGESVTALQLLDRGAAQIDLELAGEPEVQARLMAVIAQSYAGLGLYAEAEAQLERSFELQRTLFTRPHEALAAAHQQMANLRAAQGRYDDAQRHFVASLDQRLELFGPDDPRTAESQADVGAMAHLRGRLDEAEALYRQAREKLLVAPGPNAKATLQTESNLVTLLYNLGRLDEAATLGRDVYDRQRQTLGDRHPDTVATEATLAAILVADGRHDESEPLLQELLRRQTELLGPEHPDVALAANNLAAVLFYLERYDEAESLYRRALAIQEGSHGPSHAKTISTRLNLADLHALGREDDRAARPLYEQALAGRRELVAPTSLDLVNPLISLGELDLRDALPADAARRFREAVEILEADHASTTPHEPRWRLAKARGLLGEALARQQLVAEAAPLLRNAAEVLRADLGADHDETRRALDRLGELGLSRVRGDRRETAEDAADAVDHQL